MMRGGAPASAFLADLDALCEELQVICRLTRLSIVLDRGRRPLSIVYENVFHAGVRLSPTAYLEIELTDGGQRIGFVALENALATEFSADEVGMAGDVVTAYASRFLQTVPV